MAGERWLFSRSQLQDTPSRRNGMDSDKELSDRQTTANFIQDMGQKLQVSQLAINTAIVFMHRFYMFHSFKKFSKNNIGTACLFLAAKVEEQPRKLEHLIRCAYQCQNPQGHQPLDVKSEAYLEMAQELVVNENILLQTLGFTLRVEHPHSYVVKTTQMVRASKDLSQASYFLATNSLHLTTMCLQYSPAHVACVCIHIATKWSNLEIPRSSEGKEWFQYTDKDMTYQLLEEMTQDFLRILDKCPSKLKKKILTWKKDCAEDGPPEKRPKMEPSSSAGSATQAANQQRLKQEHRGEHRGQSSGSYHGHQGASRHDPSSARVKQESGYHGQRSDSSHNNLKREPGYHDKRDPGYHDPSKREQSHRDSSKREQGHHDSMKRESYHDPGKREQNLHNVKLENPASRHPNALAPQDAGMRRIKTEPSLSLTPKEYMERKEKERALQAQQGGRHSRSGESSGKVDPFKLPSSAERHHMDALSRMKERSGLHGTQPPGAESHRKEQHRQRAVGHKVPPGGADAKPRLTSPPGDAAKAQSNMFDQLEREIQRQQHHMTRGHVAAGPATAAQVPESFRSQMEQKPRSASKERDSVFSPEVHKSLSGAEIKRQPSEKHGDSQKSNRPNLPPLDISPTKSRQRTSSSSSDVSPTVARMRKDDRRLSQDAVVKLQPLASAMSPPLPNATGGPPAAASNPAAASGGGSIASTGVPHQAGSLPPPAAGDILAFCEQAAAGGEISPVQPSPTKPLHQGIKMKLGLKGTPSKGDVKQLSNNNNGELAGGDGSSAADKRVDKLSLQRDQLAKENDLTSHKRDRSLDRDRHEKRSKEHHHHRSGDKKERSESRPDLKLKISLGGSSGSPNVKSLRNEEPSKASPSATAASTSSSSDGLKLKIKLNSSEHISSSGGSGSERDANKPLKMVLKIPGGTPSGGADEETLNTKGRHHHKHKHKHKDRHKEDRHSRKRARSPGDHHHSTSSSSRGSHHPPSSKVPRSDTAQLNNTNTTHLSHGNGHHHHSSSGSGSSRNSPSVQKVQHVSYMLEKLIKQRQEEIKNAGTPTGSGGSRGPAPPPPPESGGLPPLPPGPPPSH